MVTFENNRFENFKHLRNEAQKINDEINIACVEFLNRNFGNCTFKEWNFNDRETLIEISYVLDEERDKEEDEKVQLLSVTASFDELNKIIEENSPKQRR